VDDMSYDKSLKISFCIVNWNTKYLTSQLIESIHNTVKKNSYEIIVVDNASNDGSYEYFAENFNDVIIIKSENVGYGRALNQALKIARGEYRMILNSDIILLENSVEAMVYFLDKTKDAGAVGPLLLDKDGNVEYSYGYFPRPGLMIMERLLGSITPGFICPPPLSLKPSSHSREQFEVEYITGACMLVKNDICDHIGLFDELFFLYYEETDWCYRMMKKGFRRYLLMSAQAIHYQDKSISMLSDKGKKYFEESKILYLKKHYGRLIANIYVCANKWANFRHTIKKAILN
jgi:GT2 family glycosyltransferase